MAKLGNELKTNAVRLLDQAGIAYELRQYEVDENDLSAESVAEKIGLPPEQVFKTLLCQGDTTGYLFALLPAGTELDPRLLAKASGNKRVELVSLRDVQAVTGYIRGGVSPLAAKKPYPVFMDETAQLWDTFSISAGMRGLQILLAPDDLIRITSAVLADLIRTAANATSPSA
jgi:Cys-tRNA(Pro)/Cys-tRNA(Cys) deacylase